MKTDHTQASTFTLYAVEMMNRRGVTEQEMDAFARILEKAEETGKEAQPNQVLSSLSGDELEVLRKVHTLADTINPARVSHEGSYNLLSQPGNVSDFNDDGIVEVGVGKSFQYPPPNAPEYVKKAWNTLTRDMSFKEKMLLQGKFLAKQLSANIKEIDGRVVVIEPGEPGYNNIYAEGASHEDIIMDMLEELETMKQSIPIHQYVTEKTQLSRFLELLQDV